MELKYFSELCRCCMSNGNIGIFETVFEGHSLAAIIERCTCSTISTYDKLPHNICQTCFDKLATCYLFITKYLEVQVSLLKIADLGLSKGNNEFKEHISNISKDLEHDAEYLPAMSPKPSPSNDDLYSSEDEKPLSTWKQEKSVEPFGGILAKNIQTHNNLKETPKHSSNYVITLKQNVIETNEQICRIQHTKLKNVSKKYVCSKCQECFSFIKLLEKHCKDTGHPVPRRHGCDICLMKFSTKSCLKAHMRTHSKERPHVCEQCGMKFSLRSNLLRHKRRHTGEKAFFCEICGRGFIQKHTLMIHMRLHNGETPYVCQQCGKGYRAKPLLTQHLKKHSGLETYYREHYLKHGSRKVECTVCKKLLTKSGLYTHMKVQHGDGMKKFLCNLCGKTYSSKKSLETHMNVHTKKITYNCNLCLKSFSHQNYLKTHMRIHSGEKPHCCEVCGRTFTQRAHLDGHMRTHTGAKPFTCTYCKKSFALNGNLKVHMRIHTGETPHQCVICNKGFFDSSNKRKHESTVHQLNRKVE